MAHCAEDQPAQSPRRLAMMTGAVLLLCVLTGCARKAPGPAECEAMAFQWAGVEPIQIETRRVLLQRPMQEAEITELINLCLTTPFDRALIRCVQGGTSPRLCVRAFDERTRRRSNR